jgi:uncharacterized protein YeaO (DUF488 family)
MLRMKRVYETASPEDGIRILVERLWPRGMSKERAKVDIWCREISPSPELHKWYGHRPERFPQFKERYLAELRDNEKVEQLARLSQERDVTMVFASRDVQRSNAMVLYELLTQEKQG